MPNALCNERLADVFLESRGDRGNPDASVLEMLTDAALSHTDDVLWDQLDEAIRSRPEPR
jgi:hypothetical protein